jgi:hypothetical protein
LVRLISAFANDKTPRTEGAIPELIQVRIAGLFRQTLKFFGASEGHYGDSVSISARIGSLREEIRVIQNQERFFRTLKRNSFEESAAHARRELRLRDIQGELQELQRRKLGRGKNN